MERVENNDRWMYKSYWKWIGVGIFVYVLLGGLLTPLKPGIEEVSSEKSTYKPSETVTLNVKGYNTHFSDNNNTSVWLKLDSTHFVESSIVRIFNESNLEATFTLPYQQVKVMGVDPMTLIVLNDTDGYALQPDALSIKWDTTQAFYNKIEWIRDMDRVSANNTFGFPYRNILMETIRNTFFHVALWLAMVILLLAGLYHAIRYLRSKSLRDDYLSESYNTVAIIYGLLGLATGSIWARYTWGTWWTSDIKLNMSAIAMLIYLAYFILRVSTKDSEKRAKLSAGYSIFSFATLLPLIFVIPRLYDSLHPGNGGNPALGGEDLDSTLRMFFYPSIIGLILLGVWIATLHYRYKKLCDKILTE
jgi:heme exporter protein C